MGPLMTATWSQNFSILSQTVQELWPFEVTEVTKNGPKTARFSAARAAPSRWRRGDHAKLSLGSLAFQGGPEHVSSTNNKRATDIYVGSKNVQEEEEEKKKKKEKENFLLFLLWIPMSI